MQIAGKKVEIFKIKNRRGYAAVCLGCLTEGNTVHQACDRMAKAIRRISKRKKNK
jgi:hypothetical protein